MSTSKTDYMSDTLSDNTEDGVTISLTASLLDTEISKKQSDRGPSMSEIDRNLKKMRYRLVSDEEYSVISKMSNYKSDQKGGSITATKTLSETSEFENDEPSISLSKNISSNMTSTRVDASATQVTDSEKISESSIFKELGLTEPEASVATAFDNDRGKDKEKNVSVSTLLSETSEFVDE
jgi:hypothetical protein